MCGHIRRMRILILMPCNFCISISIMKLETRECLWFAIAIWMRQAMSLSKGQLWFWSRKCLQLGSHTFQGTRSYCGHFQLHMYFWLLDRIGNYLIIWTVASHGDCHFKFKSQSWDAKVMWGHDEASLSFHAIIHAFSLVFIIEPIIIFICWARNLISL